ncbi:hypothetical protein [Streptomyces lydicus]|uniref:hypothetical protein n=1 Tax=Streptomyces lydicus TaxID=47763 RepID=UPI0036DFE189
MRSGTGSPAEGAARLLAAAGLALDACVHARLAGRYDVITATIGQGLLFRVEAALAALAAQTVAVLATGYLLLTRERSPRRHRR